MSLLRSWVRILLSVTLGVAIILLPLFSEAGINPILELDTTTNVGETIQDINKYAVDNSEAGVDLLEFSVTGSNRSTVRFLRENYAQYSSSEKKDIMEEALLSIKGSNLPGKDKTLVFNFLRNQDEPLTSTLRDLDRDVKADYVGAMSIFNRGSGFVSTLSGLMVILIFILLSLTFLLDLSWLTFAPLQGILSKSDGSKPRIISRSAFSSLREAEQDSRYREVVIIYFKKRVVSVIAISVAVAFLASGFIYTLFADIIDIITSLL